MTGRRVVRCAPSFFDRLDAQLPTERGASGTPSATDFLVHELPTCIDLLAKDAELVTRPIPGIAGVRVLVVGGRLVSSLALYVVVTGDGAVEIISVEVDLTPPSGRADVLRARWAAS